MVRKEAQFFFSFKMVSNSSHHRRTRTTGSVINVAFADDDSSDEFLESSHKYEVGETLSDDESNTSDTIDTDATNGRRVQKRRGPRSRGGESS